MPFAPADMLVRSTAFTHGTTIPSKHTGVGEDVSPTLEWSDPPEGTMSFAVVCFDPDAPLIDNGGLGWVHWVLYNLPGQTTGLAEGTDEGTKGRIDSDGLGYAGPMPPPGHGRHHYFFWVIALDRELDLEPGLDFRQLMERIEPHVLGASRLMGTFER